MIHPDGFYYYLINGETFCFSTEQAKHSGKEIEPTEEPYKTIHAEFAKNEYARNRADAYPSIGDQLDMQYWDQVNGTTTWKDAVAKVKADNPKPE